MARKKTSAPAEPARPGDAPANSTPAGSAPAGPAPEPPAAPAPFGAADAQALIAAGRLDVAAGLILAALDRRAGDGEAAAAAAIMRAQQALLAETPAVHGLPRRMPHFNERGAAAFTELLALLRLQDGQLAEMQAMLAELT